MTGPAETLLARATLGRHLAVRAGEPVTIEAWSQALPWARAFVVEARRLGLEPILAIEDEEGFFRSLACGSPVPTAPAALARFGGAYAYFPGPEAFPRLLGLSADDLGLALERHGNGWRAAARASGVRAVSLTVATVTATAAARFGVDGDTWRNEVVEASLVPPSRLATLAAQLVRPLLRARTVTVRHPNGTRLQLRLRTGRWTEESGRVPRASHRRDAIWATVPTGRLVLPTASGAAYGTWEANRPAYDRLGEPPVGIGARFTFLNGRLTDVGFDRGGEAFAPARADARRRSDLVKGLSVGLNPCIVRAPEIGDLGAGVLGLRLGAPSDHEGRRGRSGTFVSLLHGADVELDGRPWLAGGRAVRPRTTDR